MLPSWTSPLGLPVFYLTSQVSESSGGSGGDGGQSDAPRLSASMAGKTDGRGRPELRCGVRAHRFRQEALGP